MQACAGRAVKVSPVIKLVRPCPRAVSEDAVFYQLAKAGAWVVPIYLGIKCWMGFQKRESFNRDQPQERNRRDISTSDSRLIEYKKRRSGI
jgi:hypothetical protein